jgi:4-hydroxybenzoate polyprenyltransferase
MTARTPSMSVPAKTAGRDAGWRIWLRLGRVSNLPTIWTNALAAVLLAKTPFDPWGGAMLAAAFSLSYVGGMFLNDAFDREIDARERPDRPIPRGLVQARQVFVAGFVLLALGTVLVGVTAVAVYGTSPLRALLGSTLLGGAIVLYNAWHKGNPFGPVLMATCRVLVYATAALCVTGRLDPEVVRAAALLLAYVMGLTYVAKQENLTEFHNVWPLVPLLVPFAITAPEALENRTGAIVWVFFLLWVARSVLRLRTKGRGVIPRVVVALISAISLFDALVVAVHGANGAAIALTGGFALTLFLQRYVSGT